MNAYEIKPNREVICVKAINIKVNGVTLCNTKTIHITDAKRMVKEAIERVCPNFVEIKHEQGADFINFIPISAITNPLVPERMRTFEIITRQSLEELGLECTARLNRGWTLWGQPIPLPYKHSLEFAQGMMLEVPDLVPVQSAE